MKCHTFRLIAISLFLIIASLNNVGAQEATYPNKPIRLIVPFPAGGAVDIVGRAVGQGLSATWGTPVIIENRPGAGAMIGSDAVAKSPPDGYTLLMGSMSSLAVNVSLFKGKITYDPIKDFSPVVLVAHTPGILVVNPKLQANSLNDLVKLAQTSPGKMTYASSGNGNFQHLVGELFKRATQTNMIHVPYKGSAPALVDVTGGQVDMMIDVLPSAAPLVQAGKLRALAVTSITRAKNLPNVPTLDELGIRGFNVTSWYGIVVPRGTPKHIIDKLNDGIMSVLRSNEMEKQLEKIGAAPLGSSPAEFGEFLQAEVSRWREVINSNSITPE